MVQHQRDGKKMYEITFTEAFKDGLVRLPKEVHPIIDRQLRLLETDPFAKNPNATRMKNAPCSFRARIGIHVRMLYRVHSKDKRVVVQAIGTREHIYEQKTRDLPPLTPQEVKEILAEIRGAPKVPMPEIAGQPRSPSTTPFVPNVPVITEVIPWITEDELFLLQIPQQHWSEVVNARSIDELKVVNLDDWTKTLIEDYWTAPSPTQVEKLYSLSLGQDCSAIAQQPLSHFLIALDPEQSEVLERIKGNGPYLLKGSAGTGKSLVGLYHMRDLIQHRVGSSLFDGSTDRYGVITYTNTLVHASQTLLESISPSSAHSEIQCSTLDKIAYDLAAKALDRKPMALNTEGIAKWLHLYVMPGLDPMERNIVERLGLDYIADELEQVIHGNGLVSLSEYLEVSRSGRKYRLRDVERKTLWKVYEAFKLVCQQRNAQTFEEWRLLALNYLRSSSTYPRFTALFVDEAQDFSKVARQLCLELVKDPRHLLLAADSGQSIYATPPSWAQSDSRLKLTGKSFSLRRSYRATREIGQAIAPLRMELPDGEEPSGHAGPVFSGPKPQWIELPLETHADAVCRLVMQHTQATPPVHPGQIAVIVRDNGHAQKYEIALKRNGIQAARVSKESPLKIDAKHVHIITAHSSKGLGFPVVIVPEVEAGTYPWKYLMEKANEQDQRDQIEENEQRLLYVALSRASYYLHMLTDPRNPSPFIRKLDRAAHWA
jgi:superfamily I DNA/RNA helicase/mRNA-degrading endonuclease RelE of RelBE toxin-antitoxin system